MLAEVCTWKVPTVGLGRCTAYPVGVFILTCIISPLNASVAANSWSYVHFKFPCLHMHGPRELHLTGYG